MARTRAHDYDDKRRAILHRTAELFARHGFTGASITKIAEACGMSKALLYHYYRDKDAVLFDILDDHLSMLVAVVEEAAAAPAGARDRLHAIVAALLDAYRDADAEHQVQITSLKLLPPDRQEQLKELERRLVRIFADALAAAVPPLAADRTLLMPLTMSLFGMLNWHYLWFREGKGLSRADYARLATELILSGAADALAAVQGKAAPSRRMETA
ncbi:TetR/AcrR family transcriptional regulator [Inquilinus limosus]|uniref:TetR/AcrR family transcriptional regulator n=1 Tax=Inquilinus limosus TaxID=171674 RepID=UPI00041F979A|nr:TetR/AcrR family transcriptional regulator [Inquilinus limosus]